MQNKNIYNNPEDGIDLLALIKTILSGRKTIIRFFIVFVVLGMFIAIFSEKEFTASTTVIPQTTDSKIGGNLNGLASLAGIKIGGGGTEGISASLYPKIAQSVPFQKELLKVYLKFPNVEEEITYREYYEKYKKSNVLSVIKDYTIGLPGKIMGLFKKKPINIVNTRNDSIYKISEEENRLFKQLSDQLIIDVNEKDGFVKISFSMPEALPSAQMTKKAQELLQKAIINFKIKKTKDEFDFIEDRYIQLKKDFDKKQQTLASFRDRNQGLVTSRSQSRIEILQSEYNLAQNIYSELAKQLETQKIKLKENTPVFTVIEPVSVPFTKSKPKRLLIVVAWSFLGAVLGVVAVFGSKWVNDLRKTNK